jgi:hypothetical protein
MEGVHAAMRARNLEKDQWRNREEWRLVSGRRRQLSQNRIDRHIFTMKVTKNKNKNKYSC